MTATASTRPVLGAPVTIAADLGAAMIFSA